MSGYRVKSTTKKLTTNRGHNTKSSRDACPRPTTQNNNKEEEGVEKLEWITLEQAERENDELSQRLVSEFLTERNLLPEGKELVVNEQAHLETLFSPWWAGGTARTGTIEVSK